jgi:hypothetical protein
LTELEFDCENKTDEDLRAKGLKLHRKATMPDIDKLFA